MKPQAVGGERWFLDVGRRLARVERRAHGQTAEQVLAAVQANLPILDGLVSWVPVPVTAADPGQLGELASDGTYLYVCVAVDSWLRTPLSSW